MNRKILIMVGILVLLIFMYFFMSSRKSHDKHHEHKESMNMGGVLSTVMVGNKICPVSGDKIGEMGSAVQYQYNGKIYNFCCEDCVREFKKDTEKYIKIIEEQIDSESKIESNHNHQLT